ncbi:MAG TPA: endonuclease/exonuclease/phosphatase family protein [Burkholderiales bacterium]|nr:endonuclease/exonuclease/phosphatase family protein [Burkholderiales bacterium]
MIEQLRVATLNIHKGLSQFNRRMVVHELREGLRLLDPDLVFLQEVQGLNERNALRFATWPRAPQYEYLAEERWQHAYGRNAVYEHGHHGNAILSRFPIVSVENEDVSNHRYERRGLLHCVVAVPGWRRNLHCLCVHLSLHERGRRRQLDAIAARLEALAARDLPIVVAGDFNDWRHRATRILEARLGMTEVAVVQHGRAARTYPSVLPMLRLDRIYVRGFEVLASRVHHGAPWSLLSDHLALSAELRRGARAQAA